MFWIALYGILQPEWYLIKHCSQLTSSHPRRMLGFTRRRCLGSLEKAGSYLFSVNIFVWLKQGLNLLDIIISLYPRICTELNNTACLNCQHYCFKSLQKQGVHCKFDNAAGYRNVTFKNIPQNAFSKWQDWGQRSHFWHYLQSSCSDYLWKKQPWDLLYPQPPITVIYAVVKR